MFDYSLLSNFSRISYKSKTKTIMRMGNQGLLSSKDEWIKGLCVLYSLNLIKLEQIIKLVKSEDRHKIN